MRGALQTELRAWTVKDSLELYNVNGWGRDFFTINEAGHVEVTPAGPSSARIDLRELVDDALGPVAKRALIVEVLDDRDGRAGGAQGGSVGGDRHRNPGRVERHFHARLGLQLVPELRRALGQATLAQRALDDGGQLGEGARAGRGPVLLVDRLHVPGGGRRHLRVDLGLQQGVLRDAPLRGLLLEEPLDDDLVEGLPARIVLFVAEALQLAGGSAVHLLQRDRGPSDLGDRFPGIFGGVGRG